MSEFEDTFSDARDRPKASSMACIAVSPRRVSSLLKAFANDSALLALQMVDWQLLAQWVALK